MEYFHNPAKNILRDTLLSALDVLYSLKLFL